VPSSGRRLQFQYRTQRCCGLARARSRPRGDPWHSHPPAALPCKLAGRSLRARNARLSLEIRATLPASGSLHQHAWRPGTTSTDQKACRQVEFDAQRGSVLARISRELSTEFGFGRSSHQCRLPCKGHETSVNLHHLRNVNLACALLPRPQASDARSASKICAPVAICSSG